MGWYNNNEPKPTKHQKQTKKCQNEEEENKTAIYTPRSALRYTAVARSTIGPWQDYRHKVFCESRNENFVRCLVVCLANLKIYNDVSWKFNAGQLPAASPRNARMMPAYALRCQDATQMRQAVGCFLVHRPCVFVLTCSMDPQYPACLCSR